MFIVRGSYRLNDRHIKRSRLYYIHTQPYKIAAQIKIWDFTTYILTFKFVSYQKFNIKLFWRILFYVKSKNTSRSII